MNNNPQKANTSIYWCKKAGLNQDHSLLDMEEIELPKMIFGQFIMAGQTILCLHKTDENIHSLQLQMSLSVTRACRTYLNEPITLFGNTLYILANRNEDIVQEKLSDLLINTSLPINSKYKMLLYSHGSKPCPDFINIINLIEKYKPVLVVLDYPFEENTQNGNNNAEAKKSFMNTLIRFLQTTSAAVLISKQLNEKINIKKEILSLRINCMGLDKSPNGYLIFQNHGNKHDFSLSRVYYNDHVEQKYTKKIFIDPQTNWFTEKRDAHVQNRPISIDHSDTALQIEKRQQRLMALALHRQGKTYKQIAMTLKKPKTTIYRWVISHNNKRSSEPIEPS